MTDLNVIMFPPNQKFNLTINWLYFNQNEIFLCGGKKCGKISKMFFPFSAVYIGTYPFQV